MKKELTLKERADLAKQLLDNPLLTIIFQDFKKEIYNLWIGTPIEKKERREFIWQYQRALTQLEGRLNRYIQEVKLERHLDDLKLKEDGDSGEEEIE